MCSRRMQIGSVVIGCIKIDNRIAIISIYASLKQFPVIVCFV